MEEKEQFIREVAEKNYILFFEHDGYTECATVNWNGKRAFLKDKLSLSDI